MSLTVHRPRSGPARAAAAPRARLLLLLATGVLLPFGVSCRSLRDFDIAEGLRSRGDLAGARSELLRMLDGGAENRAASAGVRARLTLLDRESAELQLLDARAALERESEGAAYTALARTLARNPQQPEARILIDRIWRAERRRARARERYRAAVAAGRASAALDALEECATSRLALPEATPDVVHTLFEREWSRLAAEVDARDRVHGAASLTEVVERARTLLQRRACWIASLDLPLASRLHAWEARRDRRRRMDELRARCRAHARSGAHRQACLTSLELALTDPGDEASIQLHLAQRSLWIDALRARLESAVTRGRWPLARELHGELASLGVDVVRAAGVPASDFLARHREALVEEARALDRRGLPANALLALCEALGLDPGDDACAHEVERLRERLRGAPLVRLDDDESAPLPGGAPLAPSLLVRPGRVEFHERRTTESAQVGGGMVRSGEEWRENPAYAAECRRCGGIQQRMERVRARLESSGDLERGHWENRLHSLAEELARLRRGLEHTSRLEQMSTWEREEVPVERTRLEATARLSYRWWSPDGTEHEDEIREEHEESDLHHPALVERGLPADPCELPCSEECERRLAEQCRARLARWLEGRRKEALASAIERARTLHSAGDLGPCVELLVRVLVELPPSDVGLQELAQGLLRRSTTRSDEAITSLSPPRPALEIE